MCRWTASCGVTRNPRKRRSTRSWRHRGWREVQVEARMRLEPALYRGRLVGGIVVAASRAASSTSAATRFTAAFAALRSARTPLSSTAFRAARSANRGSSTAAFGRNLGEQGPRGFSGGLQPIHEPGALGLVHYAPSEHRLNGDRSVFRSGIRRPPEEDWRRPSRSRQGEHRPNWRHPGFVGEPPRGP